MKVGGMGVVGECVEETPFSNVEITTCVYYLKI